MKKKIDKNSKKTNKLKEKEATIKKLLKEIVSLKDKLEKKEEKIKELEYERMYIKEELEKVVLDIFKYLSFKF